MPTLITFFLLFPLISSINNLVIVLPIATSMCLPLNENVQCVIISRIPLRRNRLRKSKQVSELTR